MVHEIYVLNELQSAYKYFNLTRFFTLGQSEAIGHCRSMLSRIYSAYDHPHDFTMNINEFIRSVHSSFGTYQLRSPFCLLFIEDVYERFRELLEEAFQQPNLRGKTELSMIIANLNAHLWSDLHHTITVRDYIRLFSFYPGLCNAFIGIGLLPEKRPYCYSYYNYQYNNPSDLAVMPHADPHTVECCRPLYTRSDPGYTVSSDGGDDDGDDGGDEGDDDDDDAGDDDSVDGDLGNETRRRAQRRLIFIEQPSLIDL